MPQVVLAAGQVLEYRLVRRSRQRSLRLRVDLDGGLHVSAARGTPLDVIERFLRSRAGWIERQRSRLRQEAARIPRLAPGQPVPYLGGQVLLPPSAVAWLRSQARRHFAARLTELAPRLDVSFSAPQVRGQTSRWGSCSTRGTLSLNWKLLFAPPEVVDYVLVHELAHLLEPNHSPRFWAHVARHCPDHQAHRRWLHEHAYLLQAAARP